MVGSEYMVGTNPSQTRQNFDTTNANPMHAHLGMLVWALIVGSSFPAVVMMSEGLPPLLLTAIRFIIAAIVFIPLVWNKSGRWPSLPGLALYLLMGISLAAFFGTMFWAAHRTSALSMATLYVSVPLLAYFLGRLFSVEHSSRILLSILALGASGALALAWAESGGQPGQMNFGFTELIYFFGCIASALFPVLSRWGLARGILSPSAELRTFWSLVSGALSIGLIGLVLESPLHLNRMNLIDILILTYLAVFSSGVTFWLTQRSTTVMTPGSVTAYSYLVPFVSMLLLLVEQPQQIGWHWLPGSALVLTAIIALFYQEAATSPAALSRTINRLHS
jgi:drug/metabolite transporter (DMT)-like permease